MFLFKLQEIKLGKLKTMLFR